MKYTTYQLINAETEDVVHEFYAPNLSSAIKTSNHFIKLASKFIDTKFKLFSK